MTSRIPKTPPRTLVHRSLLRARLYHSSRCPGILEVMNRKNAESGPGNFRVLRRESGRSHLAMLLRPKAGGDVVWDSGEAPDEGYGCLLPGYVRDNEEFSRAENFSNPEKADSGQRPYTIPCDEFFCSVQNRIRFGRRAGRYRTVVLSFPASIIP
jgi:hypothetical protein